MPSKVTISGYPEGFNCLLTVRKYGSAAVRCTDVSYALTIGSTEDEAAAQRVYYPLNQYIAAYDLIFAFKSKAERDSLNNWLRNYMRKVSSNQSIGGYVFVQVPARNTAFNGIPLGPLTYGEQTPQVLQYTAQMRFVGASSPISAVGQKSALAGISQFKLPSKDTKEAPYFYPAGNQQSGAVSLQGTLYDPIPVSQIPDTTSGGGGGGGRQHESIW